MTTTARATYDNSDLRQRNLLCKLEITTFGTVRKNKRASSEACVREGANDRVAAVIQQLFDPSNPMLKKIVSLRGLMRNLHGSSTGPWDDEGFRIIRADAFGDYKEKQDDLITQFNAAVDELCKNRDDIVHDAQIKLGALFDPKDYPTGEELRARYSAELIAEIIPNRKDPRLDMDKDRQEKIVEEAQEAERAKIARNREHIIDTIVEELTHMRDALNRSGTKEDGDVRAGAFRNSLVPRMQKLAATLPALNITNDPKITKIAQEIAQSLCIHTSEDLREDEVLREQVKGKADDMLETMGAYFGDDAK